MPLSIVRDVGGKLEDGGSIFFNQKRMGKFGKEFMMFIRSMREVTPSQPTLGDD